MTTTDPRAWLDAMFDTAADAVDTYPKDGTAYTDDATKLYATITEHLPAMAAALTAVLKILDELDAKHQIHGHECLCGFKSARSRDRTEHLTAEVRRAITDHLPGGNHG